MKKSFTLLLTILVCMVASAKDVYKFTLGDKLTLEQAKVSTEGFAIVHNNRVLCKSGGELLMVNVAEIDGSISWQATFEDGTDDANYIKIAGQYVNASAWSHTFLSGKSGEKDNGTLWTIAEAAEKAYTIRNLGVEQGNYDNSLNNNGVQSDKGWLKDTTDGYWKNHATWQNAAGDEWSFYTLEKELVATTSWTWTKVSFDEALVSSVPVVMVQNNLVLTNSNGGVNYSTKNDFDSFAYWVKFEAYNAGENQYYITLNKENGEKVNYFNASYWSHVYLSGVDKEGTRGEKQNSAIFTIAEMGENQYSIRNLGSVEGCYGEDQQEKGYVNFTTDPTAYWKNNATWQNASPIAWEFYTVTDRQVVPLDPNTPTYDKVEADLTTFALEKLDGNNWHFNTPADLFDYKYLVVVTKEASGNKNGYMILTDNTGKRAGNNWGSDLEINYNAEAAGTRGGMWLDRWNNQICACINLAWIREQGLDIRNITNFSVPNGANIAGVFLTNYAEGNGIKNVGGSYPAGDHQRTNGLLDEETAKFGTVALKYTSVVSGAKLYTVDSFDAESGMELAEKSDYIAEAGVPYIFLTCDFEGNGANGGNKGTASNVNFYRVDANAVSGDWSDNNARDNGLVGYYDGGFWPGAGALNGCYLLAQNELHFIDGGDITLGTNRCFFDPAKYQGPKSTAGAKVRVAVSGVEEETAIKAIEKTLKSDKIYDLNGREVKSMQPGGVYIMGGMKVRVK